MEITEFTPGRFCWVELATSDDQAAKRFYSELFDWKTETNAMGEDLGDYTMLRLGDKEVGALYRLPPAMAQAGVPPHWLSYVGVVDADATAAKAKGLGGTLIQGPLDVFDIGRMAILADPTGAAFALWQAKTHRGQQVTGEPGATCWNELLTNDTKKAGAFYTELFGWTAHEMPMGSTTYTMFGTGEQPAGGMMAAPPEMGAAPPNWLVYFAVGDCDEDVQRAESMGAKVSAPPSDVPGVGRMAVLSDPQGAAFAIIRLSEDTTA